MQFHAMIWRFWLAFEAIPLASVAVMSGNCALVSRAKL